MSLTEVDDKTSVARSDLSLKTNSPPIHRPTLIDYNLIKKSKSKIRIISKVSKALWSILICLIVSCSLVGFVESAKLCFIANGNNTSFSVNPPAFLTYLSTIWLVIFYPLQYITHICKKEKNNGDLLNFKQNFLSLFPEKLKWYRYITRIVILIVLWNAMIYSIIKSAYYVTSIDIVVLFCTNTSTMYLLYWVIMHKKFVALRIIAFILSSSGMIVNVYDNTSIIWYKILVSTATVAYAVFYVYSKSLILPKNQNQIYLIYSFLAIINTLVAWPIFIFTSIVTSSEMINWKTIPWNYFIGCGISVLCLFVSIEISYLTSTRGMRNMLFLGALPIVFLVDKYWLKVPIQISELQIVSIVLIIISIVFASIPSGWMDSCSSKIFKKHSPYQTRRVSISARSNLMGNGSVRMSNSINNSSMVHRDSLASEMLHKIGNIGNHIFATQRTRQRFGSVFG